MEQSVELRRSQDSYGTRYLGAILADNGDVRIEGQDLGSGLQEIFGEGITEYEYIITIRAQDVPALLEALGAKGDVLVALQKLFSDPAAEEPKSFLDKHNVPYEFWNRMGD